MSLFSNSVVVFSFVLGKKQVWISLSWTFFVRIVHQILDAHQKLRDRQAWSPIFIFIEDRKTHCTTRVNVWMEQHWVELALWRLVWIVFTEFHHKFVDSTFPWRTFLSRNFAFPFEKLLSFTIWTCNRLSSITKWMLLPPILSFLHESLSCDVHKYFREF